MHCHAADGCTREQQTPARNAACKNRHMRRWWACFLTLTFLWSGVVAPVLAAVPCPMAAQMMAGEMPDADCCNDAETFAATGQPCKTSAQCPAPAVTLPAVLCVSTVRAATIEPAGADPGEPPPAPDDAIWRPPAPCA
jgi:hypothetical protein